MRVLISKLIVCVVSLIVVILLIGNSLQAATNQGSVDFASTATIDINVTTTDAIVIFGMRAFSFGAWTVSDGNLADNENVCIGKTNQGSPYSIQATGDGGTLDPSAFTISNGVDQIYYDVYWNDEVGTAGQVQLSSGSTLYNQDDAPNSTYIRNRVAYAVGNTNCDPGNTGPRTPRENANLQIRISSTQLSNATSGSYAGVLTLLVIPD
jgi:hypothetical protein